MRKPEFIFKLNKEKDLNELKTHENHLINWFIHEIVMVKKLVLNK